MGVKPKQLDPNPKVILNQAAPPSTGAGKGAFYPAEDGGIAEGHYVDNLGQVTKITNNGAMDAEKNTVSHVGTGEPLFKEKIGIDLKFKSIKAGANIILTPSADELEISSVDTGEANTASNEGTGQGIYIGKTGADLRFRKLLAGDNMTITQVGDDLKFDSAGEGGGVTGEANTMSNVGTAGIGVFKAKNGVDFEMYKLKAGSGMTIAIDGVTGTIEFVSTSSLGEANDGLNIGGGVGEVFKQKSGTVLEFRRLLAGTGISIVNNADEIEIINTGGLGESNTGANVGTGDGNVYKTKSGTTLQFKTIKAGANITITDGTDEVTIEAAAGSGETNTASNLGTGASAFKAKVGVDLQFRKIKAGAGIQVNEGTDDIEIVNTGGASGVTTGTIDIPAGADLAVRLAAATGLPAGWSIVLGSNGSVDAGLVTAGADANDAVLIHDEGKIGMFKVLGDFAGVWQEKIFDPAALKQLDSSNLNQALFQDFNTTAGTGAIKLLAVFF